jgi:L-threonylcarbamoyladenylate synthase
VPGIAYEATTVAEGAARASPGLAEKHYSPHARLVVVPGGAATSDAAADFSRAGARVAAIVWSDEARAACEAAKQRGLVAVLRVLGDDADAYGRDLFAALFDVDEAGSDVVVVERVPDEASWWAVNDRLRRAAARGE